MGQLAEQVRDIATVRIPFEPDTNLICLALNPAGNTRLAVMNRYARRIFSRLRVDSTQPLQLKEFFGSYTRVYRRSLGDMHCRQILEALGLDGDSFVDHPDPEAGQADNLYLLRHTLMNPWLEDRVNRINYIDLYCDYLARLIRETGSAY